MAVRKKQVNNQPHRAMEPVNLAEYIERAVRQAHVTKDATGYTAIVPPLPGCITCGDTEREAREDLRDAIEAWVLTGLRFGDLIPPIGNAILAYSVDREH